MRMDAKIVRGRRKAGLWSICHDDIIVIRIINCEGYSQQIT